MLVIIRQMQCNHTSSLYIDYNLIMFHLSILTVCLFQGRWVNKVTAEILLHFVSLACGGAIAIHHGI